MKYILPLSIILGILSPDLAHPEDLLPNIVMIMADDLGFADLGCYGSEIRTPHLDALAANGLRFRNFHTTAKCHSSRVSLLTGLYCDQAGAESLKRGVTIAEVLQSAGYRTAMVGKWHLKAEPTDRGFQRYFGSLNGASNFFTGDDRFRLDGKAWKDFAPDHYNTIAYARFAERFLEGFLSEPEKKPFFLYVAHNAPHYPLQAPEADVKKWQGFYDVGWDVIREQRLKRQVAMGLIPADWKPAPRPANVPAWDDLSAEEKSWESRRMAVFAAMIEIVDRVTGELVSLLSDRGILDNTLILFCSDNGACPFDRTHGREFEPWDSRSYWCYDTGWSHVGNAPFRLHKQNQHAGGINSPLIAHWPKGIKTQPGSITDQRAHLIDVMATAIALGKTIYPREWPGRESIEPLQGRSLLPIFQGETREPHKRLFFSFDQNRAVIEGNFKLVTHRASTWELYDLEKDGTEMNDLAAQHPEKVAEMADWWETTAVEVNRLNVAPLSNTPPPELQKNGKPVPTRKSP